MIPHNPFLYLKKIKNYLENVNGLLLVGDVDGDVLVVLVVLLEISSIDFIFIFILMKDSE